MNLLEIKGLVLVDPNFPATTYSVPTLGEMLDACRGKEKLFIELKGMTADQKQRTMSCASSAKKIWSRRS